MPRTERPIARLVQSISGGRAGARFALALAAAAVVLWLGYRDEVLGPVLVLWRIEVAKAVLGLIHGAGMEGTREASAIYHPGGFAFEISRGCTGFVPAALLATAILAYPATRSSKVLGVAVGVPLLLGINLARLSHLFYLGVYQPQWFHAAHTWCGKQSSCSPSWGSGAPGRRGPTVSAAWPSRNRRPAPP